MGILKWMLFVKIGFGEVVCFFGIRTGLYVMRVHGLMGLLVMCVRELRNYCFLSGHHEIRAFV